MAQGQQDSATVEMSESMQRIVYYAFDEAAKKLDGENGLVPFSAILSGENITIDEHEGANAQECRESARKAIMLDPATVDGYVFVYDGYIQMSDDEDDVQDAIILEVAELDADKATVLCRLYRSKDEKTPEGGDEKPQGVGHKVEAGTSGEDEPEDDEDLAVEFEDYIALVGQTESLIPPEYRTLDA